MEAEGLTNRFGRSVGVLRGKTFKVELIELHKQ